MSLTDLAALLLVSRMNQPGYVARLEQPAELVGQELLGLSLITGAGTGKAHRMADGDVHSEDFWLMTGHHSVPEVVINHDGPEERRVGFVDDFGGKIELSTQQLRNLIALLVSEDFWLITGL